MTALITGGLSGIGFGVSRAMAKCGHDLMIAGRSPESAHTRALEELREFDVEVSYVEADVAVSSGVAVIHHTLQKLHKSGPIHLVHAAVRAELQEDSIGLEGYRQASEVNAWALIALTNGIKSIFEAGSTVTLLTSEGPRRVVPGYAYVATSKAAAETAIRYLAVELAPKRVRCNTVSAGPVLTDSLRAVWPGADEKFEKLSHRAPLANPITPEDVGELVVFITSQRARSVTGQTWLVDAGASLLA